MNVTGLSLWIFWLFYMQVFQVLLGSLIHGGNETDKLSLLNFKAKVHDPLGVLSSWNESTQFCDWYGVSCGSKHQRVTALSLKSSKLVGELSAFIGNLSFLRSLDLENNTFIHVIPQEIGLLRRLERLVLNNNSFSGEIPINISRCSNLFQLALAFNNLSGELPPQLGALSKLQIFYFVRNSLVGTIPPSFGNLSLLTRIGGAENNFHGSIPESFGVLKMLIVFMFGGNSLTGIIPPSMYNLSSLRYFEVADNHLHGTLPPDLGFTLPNLVLFGISDNQFTGTIPDSLSNASELIFLEAAVNRFSGRVPNFAGLNNLQFLNWEGNDLGDGKEGDMHFLYSLVNFSQLIGLGFTSNNLGGILPRIIGNFSKTLSEFGLGDNQIRGSIPSELGNLIGLTRLGMDTNQLSGSIPSSMGKLQNLGFLNISGNELSGSIPLSIGNITALQDLDLSFNNLQGKIPSTLEKCRRLFFIGLENNRLSGTVPREVMVTASVAWLLDLSNNQLVGSIPAEIGSLVSLGILDLSHNKLSGEIPETLGSCTSLESLYLNDNHLHGNIPKAFDSLRGIRHLDLSLNNLSGTIPEYLVSVKLESLNLSFNNFEGEVPTEGIFKNASVVSLVGNTNLCGGISELHLPLCSIKDSRKSGASSLKLIIPVVLSVFLLIVVLCLTIVYYLRKRKLKASSSPPLLGSMLQVSYNHLVKATSGFSSDNLIGMGRFGSVFKGILNYDQPIAVAVKVLNLQHRGATQSFLAECEALRNIRHRNLVKIITACVSIDPLGNDFKALVYDLMVNGSLEEWLHSINEANEEPRYLNLLQRLNITIDVASALAYLHLHCQPPIVHSDLKPSNVLLDNEMVGHVGDFGLARLLPEETSQIISSNSASSTGPLGTMGYTAPEYGMGIRASKSGDVYSFGILTLEIFTGKRPTDEIFKDGFNLHNFVKTASGKNLKEIMDPTLLQEIEDEELNGESSMWMNDEIKQCLVSVFQVGIACSAQLPKDRMNICDVEAQLQSIRKKLVKSSQYRENQ